MEVQPLELGSSCKGEWKGSSEKVEAQSIKGKQASGSGLYPIMTEQKLHKVVHAFL